MEETLFRSNVKNGAPLADRMRPRTLDEFVGQKHIVGEGKLLRRAILSDRLQSTIFSARRVRGKRRSLPSSQRARARRFKSSTQSAPASRNCARSWTLRQSGLH